MKKIPPNPKDDFEYEVINGGGGMKKGLCFCEDTEKYTSYVINGV